MKIKTTMINIAQDNCSDMNSNNLKTMANICFLNLKLKEVIQRKTKETAIDAYFIFKALVQR